MAKILAILAQGCGSRKSSEEPEEETDPLMPAGLPAEASDDPGGFRGESKRVLRDFVRGLAPGLSAADRAKLIAGEKARLAVWAKKEADKKAARRTEYEVKSADEERLRRRNHA